MLNPDDLDPSRVALKPVDLQQMSIDELKEYIAALDAEIGRVEAMIEKKQAHRSGVDSLFKSS